MSAADRSAIVEAGRWLAERSLAPGSSGNISVRSGDGFLMTPTGTALRRLTEDSLSALDAVGERLSGDEPTKERALHLAVYAARPTAHAVVHLHSSYAVALSCRADLDPDAPLAPLTPYQVMRVDPIGVVPYLRPGSLELAEAVGVVAATHAALLLLNHGSLVAADSLDAAVFAAEEFEEVAKLELILGEKAVRALTPDEVEDIRRNLRR